MAAKKAALLEKRLRREKEAQEKKQQQELDQEQKREAARLKAEEEQQKKDDEKARREYIKNEYLRRKQLKLMEDMDEVIKPRSGSLKKKPRPKSIHRDVMESSTPSVKASGQQHTSHMYKHTCTAVDLCLTCRLFSCCRGASSRLLSVECFFGIS